MDGCVFCSIARDELAAPVVYRDERVLAFLDHRPLFPGHTLLIPRDHHQTLADLPDALLEPLFSATRTLARAVQHAMGAQGSFVAMNNVVSQSVPHLHVHIVPRRSKDGLRGFFWPRTKYANDAHVEQVRAAIAEALAD